MSEPLMRTSATNTIVYLSIPEGRRVYGKVKLVQGTDDLAQSVHPKSRHRWHEMLHYGQSGTGFVQCRCGAIGVPFREQRRAGVRLNTGRHWQDLGHGSAVGIAQESERESERIETARPARTRCPVCRREMGYGRIACSKACARAYWGGQAV